jgi:protein-disulfide isomerase
MTFITLLLLAQPVLEIYSDFQCPYCARLAPEIERLRSAAGGKLTVEFRHFPLDFHRDAPLAHRMAVAAGEQGKFWEMHDLIFSGRLGLSREALFTYASDLGLDMVRIHAELGSDRLNQVVERDKMRAATLNVQGTPTLFLDGEKLEGGRTFRSIRRAIEQQAGTQLRETLPKGALSLGPAAATVRIELFLDLTSAGAGQMLRDSLRAFADCGPQCELAFRNLAIDPMSRPAHVGAMAAAAQGKLWEMAELIAAQAEPISFDGLIPLASRLGLNLERFWRDVADDNYDNAIEADLADAKSRGIGTSQIRIDGETAAVRSKMSTQ